MKYIHIIIIILIVSSEYGFCGFWKYQTSFVGDQYYKIGVYDSNNIYIIGKSQIRSRCEYTSDGGKNWTNILPDSLIFKDPNNKKGKINTKSIYVCKEPDKDIIIIGCDGDSLLISKNKGKTWRRIDLLARNHPITTIERIKQNTYYCLGISTIHISKDAGETWKILKSPFSTKYVESIFNCLPLSESECFLSFKKVIEKDGILLYKSVCYKTKNSGATWEEYSFNTIPNSVQTLGKISRVNDSLLFSQVLYNDSVMKKQYSVIYKSINNGIDWQYIDTTSIPITNSMLCFSNESIGFIAKKNGMIYNTKDGGHTWIQDTIEFSKSNSLEDVVALNENKFMMINQFQTFINDGRATSVNEPFVHSLNIFPNPLPINMPLNIGFNTEKTYNEVKISILDLSGRIIDESTSFGGELNLQYLPESDLSPGTYFIVISSNGEVLGREKFIIVE